jgi:hypothetical protein
MWTSLVSRRWGWLFLAISLCGAGCVTPSVTLDPLVARIVSHSSLNPNSGESRFVLTFVVEPELAVKDLTMVGTGTTKGQGRFELNFDDQKTTPEAYTLQGVSHVVFQLTSMWAVVTALQSKDVPLYLKWDETKGVAAISKDPTFHAVEAWPSLKIEPHPAAK